MNLPHEFVNVSLMPIDTRVASDGAVEFTEAPERQEDHTPEQMCRICFVPLNGDSVNGSCDGAGVPDDISGIIDTRPEEG